MASKFQTRTRHTVLRETKYLLLTTTCYKILIQAIGQHISVALPLKYEEVPGQEGEGGSYHEDSL